MKLDLPAVGVERWYETVLFAGRNLVAQNDSVSLKDFPVDGGGLGSLLDAVDTFFPGKSTLIKCC